MPAPLLDTKLFVPRPRAGLVARPRLENGLQRALEARLTLVSAPPGCGKTTLLTAWLAAARPEVVGWVSLDATDDDPATFWAYVIAALRPALPAGGSAALELLETPGVPIERVLTALLNELAAAPGPVVLVLDDLHAITSPAIHAGLAFLVDHLPAAVHVVITTRADPPLPLSRLRARGDLVEVRAADLRFTTPEAADYLARATGGALAPEVVDALERRTEGWIAALQLAGLSLRDRADPAAFVDDFSGDDRYVVDYLVDEVLDRQPDAIRSFLLRTSILARMTGGLCDAVTGRDEGRATLEALERANLLLVPLDDHRRWYRYHHLFGDVLRARLEHEHGAEVADLHRRASAWLAANGDPAEAIRHALAAPDPERAADLMEASIPELRRTRDERRLRTWLEALPPGVLEERPALGLTYAGTRLQTGEPAGVERYLDAAERWVASPTGHGADETRRRAMTVEAAMYRSALALLTGDRVGAARAADRAMAASAPEDHLGRGAAATLSGLALWGRGDLDGALARYAQGMASLERAGHRSDVIGCLLAVADMRIAQGRLEEALVTYRQGLALAEAGGPPPIRGAADMLVGIGGIACERGDLAAATAMLERSDALGEGNGLPQHPARWRLLAARIRQAHGDLAGALALATDAEPRFTTDMSPDIRPIGARIARLRIAIGDLEPARAWARSRGLEPAEAPTHLREFELATLARLLLAAGARERATGPVDQAIELLERLVAAALAGGRDGSALDALVVLAPALEARADGPGALRALERALAIARSQGHVRSILDEGPPLAELLRRAARAGDAEAARILALDAPPAAVSPARAGALVEPLSERELDVLRLLAGDLDGPDMASALFISLNTLRTHTKSIYGKLGVTSRRAAVRRATELGLLPG